MNNIHFSQFWLFSIITERHKLGIARYKLRNNSVIQYIMSHKLQVHTFVCVVCVCVYGWMVGWMDGWTNGRMDGWTDGWTDG